MPRSPLPSILAAFVFVTGLCGISSAQVVLQTAFGDTTVKKASSSKWEKALPKTILSVGDTVRTAGRSGAIIFVRSEQSVISLSEDSKLMITETMIEKKSRTPGFLLFLGAMKARILKNPDEPMDFTTPTAVVGVRGTEFLVAVAEDGTSRVAVTRGEVSVEGGRNSVSLSSNESSTVALAGDPQDKVLFTGEDAEIARWRKSEASRIKGREALLLDQCGKALELNYGKIDDLRKRKQEKLDRIDALKAERRKAEAEGDAAGARAAGLDATDLVTAATVLVVQANNLDRRDQALFEVAERLYASAANDRSVKSKFETIRNGYQKSHASFLLRKKKSCLLGGVPR